MAVIYEPTVFVNGDDPSFVAGSSPCVGATELNKLGRGIQSCAEAITTMQEDMASASYTLEFTDADWIYADSTYSMTLTAETHGKGASYVVGVYKKLSSGYMMSWGAYTDFWWTATVADNGDLTLASSAAFSGRAVLV